MFIGGTVIPASAYQESRVWIPGGSPPFVPTDIAGCVQWLDASQLGLTDGTQVSLWTDESGNGNDATQPTSGNQPIFKTAILNGKPVVRFDGSTDYFTVALTETDISIFTVINQTGDAGIYAGAFFNPQFRIGQSANTISTFDGGNNPSSSTLGVAQGNFSLIEYITTSGTVAFFQNGNAYGTGSYSGSHTIVVFGALNAGALFVAGDIAESVVYDSGLGTTNRQSVENYLIAKYAL